MHKAKLVKVGVGSAVAMAIALGLASPASADVQPRSTDAVGVGSDTVQYVGDFVSDGSPSGLPGFNTLNTSRRIFSFDATADASGRAAYRPNSSTSLAPSVVLRAGSAPVIRPNGSGAGITALNADTATPHKIDFVRSSRLPTGAEENTASANGSGGLHVYQIATDGMDIAVRSTATGGTNSPGALSAQVLADIYTGNIKKWNQIPGNSGGSSDDIVPILPQTSSGTYGDFTTNIQALTGVNLKTTTLSSNVKFAEEHDPTAITTISGTDADGNTVTPADGITPFSTGRDKLIDTGYFGTTPAPNTIDLLTGSGAYHLNRSLYVIVRQSDVTSTTPFAAGGTKNLVNTFFAGPGSQFGKVASSALFTAAGVTQANADLGLNP